MKIAHRFAWYLGGFGLGLILLFFFLSGKKTSCDYGPDARVMKNIRLKERIYTEEALNALRNYNLDTAAVSTLLRIGDVNFGKSNTDLDSCKQYLIEGTVDKKELAALFENCDSMARIINIIVY